MIREAIYILIITLFFIWGGAGIINPQLHRKFANSAIYWMSLSGVLAILVILVEMFNSSEFVLFGFAQALALTSALSLFLLPLLINEKNIITYFSPLWFLVVTIALVTSFIFPATNKVFIVNWSFEIHFFLSMFAYAFFTIWAVVSIILLIQSARLHHPQNVEKIKQLPPLLVIEKNSIWLGRLTFIFLSLVLITGLVYSNISIGKVALTHKFIFALITWVGVLFIVFGQIFRGWRGRKINISVLVCYFFIILAYIGYRFVLEIILGRGV